MSMGKLDQTKYLSSGRSCTLAKLAFDVLASTAQTSPGPVPVRLKDDFDTAGPVELARNDQFDN
jgi:hypothetical protein